MAEATSLGPTSDERMMSALAHFFGVIAALIIWAAQKDKSRFVRFQAAQALVFDFAVMLLTGVLFACFFGLMFLGMFGTMFTSFNSHTSSESFGPFLMLSMMFPFLMSTCILPFSLALFITRVVATISVLNGNDFHYPFLGARVEKFLAN